MWSILFSPKEKSMNRKKPNKILTPLVIAGITIGFLGAAYKFIFVDSKRTEKAHPKTPDAEGHENDTTKKS